MNSETFKNRYNPLEHLSKGRLTKFLVEFLRWSILIFFAVMTAFPLIWTLFSSVKSSQEILMSALSFPKKLHWENYGYALKVTGMGQSYLNSIIVTTISVLLNAYVSLLAAYTIARFRFRGSGFLMALFSIGILIPINSALLPVKIIMDNLQLSNSLIGLAILYTAIGIPISILILRSFLLGIPVQVDEAARIDGASLWRTVWAIIMPMARPGIVTVMILQAIYCWNEFLYAIVLIASPMNRTLQIAIRFFLGQFFFDYGALFAAMTLAIIPTVVLFVIFQNSVVSSLSMGAVKQ